MATKRVIHSSKLRGLFPEFSKLKVLKKGSTSVIAEDPIYDNRVIVYTTDYAKVLWFKKISNKVNFSFIEEKEEGFVQDEIKNKIYVFKINRMETLDQKRKDYVYEHILSLYQKNETKEIRKYLDNPEILKNRKIISKFEQNMKFHKMARISKDKRVKYMMSCLESFIENNSVAVDLKIDSFMKLPNGDIVCTDPVYSTKLV